MKTLGGPPNALKPAFSTRERIATIKTSVDIIGVVSAYVRLKRIGATQSYVALCPFHTEKTPSFRVHRDRPFFKCFGCGARGDVFSFVQKIEGVGFRRAVELIAARVGLPVRTLTPQERSAYSGRRREAEWVALAAEDWRRGKLLIAERQYAADCDRGGGAPASLTWLPRLIWQARNAGPAGLVFDDYLGALRRDAAETVDHARAGREDRKHAESITCLIVDMLAARQAEEAVA